MTTLSKFAERMRQTAKHVDANSNMLVKRTAIATLTEIVQRTPIDTGRAKSNWLVSTWGPMGGIREPFAYGFQGSTKTANEQATIADGTYRINQFRITFGMEKIYITNNLDYIELLELGSSKTQAPTGFVDLGMIQGAGVVHRSSLLKYNGVAK